jgi:HSP20 family protein
MALVRWDPFRELTALQTEVNRLFSRVGNGDVAERQSWTPAIDVVENDNAIVLKAELAGMDPKDINIEVQDNVLTVSGERRFGEEVKEDKYYRIERRYGSFSRSLALPQAVNEDGIEAKYENGLLEVTLPKAEIAKPKKITVAVGEGRQATVEATGREAQPVSLL